MKVYDLNTNSEYEFSHNDINLAFAYVIAEKKSIMSMFAYKPQKVVEDFVLGNVSKGAYGYHLNGLSIPFSSIKEA